MEVFFYLCLQVLGIFCHGSVSNAKKFSFDFLPVNLFFFAIQYFFFVSLSWYFSVCLTKSLCIFVFLCQLSLSVSQSMLLCPFVYLSIVCNLWMNPPQFFHTPHLCRIRTPPHPFTIVVIEITTHSNNFIKQRFFGLF